VRSETAVAELAKVAAFRAAPPDTTPVVECSVRVRSMIASSSASVRRPPPSAPSTIACAPNVSDARSSWPLGSAARGPPSPAATRAPSRLTMESRYSFFSARWTMRSSTVPAVTSR